MGKREPRADSRPRNRAPARKRRARDQQNINNNTVDRPLNKTQQHQHIVQANDPETPIALDISKIARALLARLLFVIHSMVTIWQTVEVYEEQAYWSFSFITIIMLIEGAVTVCNRGGDERKWFCPSVFLYILCTVPSIWFLELDLSKKRLAAYNKNDTTTHIAASDSEVGATLHISYELWVQLLEQFLLVILIVGRWMLPKGVITREQLSQILLAYLAIASDIVELFDAFKEPAVVRHKHLRFLILAVWSLSLLQFPFVLTASKARKMRIAITQTSAADDIRRIQQRLDAVASGQAKSTMHQMLYDSDIWAILLANGLQDCPFLVLRVYMMFGYGVMTYTMIFFTCKNALIIALQTYRLVILINDRYDVRSQDDDARQLANYYRQILQSCRESLSELKRSHPEVAADSHREKRKGNHHRSRGNDPPGGGNGGGGGVADRRPSHTESYTDRTDRRPSSSPRRPHTEQRKERDRFTEPPDISPSETPRRRHQKTTKVADEIREERECDLDEMTSLDHRSFDRLRPDRRAADAQSDEISDSGSQTQTRTRRKRRDIRQARDHRPHDL